MMYALECSALLLASASVAGAQELRFVHPPPAASTVTVSRDVQYGASGSEALAMDVYRASGSGPAPTLAFFNFGGSQRRADPFYVAWAQLAASKGIAAILPDLRFDHAVEDMTKLLEYLASPGSAAHGIDRNAIAVYAGSGNVSRALPFLQQRPTAVKAAVMYYGTAEIQEFRLDLPVLFVRAGLDRPSLNDAITRLVSAAVSQNAPWTLLNHAGGRHGFEVRNDDDATRRVIDETLNFVKAATAPAYQSALRQALPEALAAGHVTAGRTAEAAAAYSQLVSRRPDDATLRLAYGEALLANNRFGAACAELAKLKGQGLGFRDLGVPAARACVQAGDADAAIAWIAGIPPQFRPQSLRDDPAFATIRDRAEFKALFPPR